MMLVGYSQMQNNCTNELRMKYCLRKQKVYSLPLISWNKYHQLESTEVTSDQGTLLINPGFCQFIGL